MPDADGNFKGIAVPWVPPDLRAVPCSECGGPTLEVEGWLVCVACGIRL